MGFLRFFLAYVVLLAHCPEGLLPKIFHSSLAVQCFFTISGFYMQPSEFMKICIILSLAKFFDEKQIKDKRDYFFLVLPIAIVLLPFGLIISQPDLGTASMILFISFLIFFISGLSWKFFGLIGIGFLTIAPYLWNSLKNYQKQRILTLFNPENDPLGSGYHIIQSQIAIGSGGLYGKGFGNGAQSHLDFIPESNTDFILAVLAEEFGLLGVLFLVCLYLFVLIRGLFIIIMNFLVP